MTASRKATIALVNAAWDALPTLAGISWVDGAQRLLESTADAERKHRKLAPADFRYPVSVMQASKLLAVHDLACALKEGPPPPTWEQYLTCRPSWLIARALAHVNRDAILRAWADQGLTLEELCPLDYAEFVK